MDRELAATSQEFEFRSQRSCGSPLSALSDLGQSAQTRSELQCNKHFKNVKKVRFHALCKFDALLN